jgi:hypothetical protein
VTELSAFTAESLADGASAGRRTKVTLEPYTVYVFETRTGRVVDKVPYVGTPSWVSGINDPGAGWSVTVPLRGHASGAGMDPETMDSLTVPWRFSWAIATGSKIWQAGPVISESPPSGNSSTVSGGGLWSLLSNKRALINPARAALGIVTGTDADVVFGPTGYTPVMGGTVPAGNKDLSLHTIGKRIVQTITSAAGGNLPVVYPDDIAGSSIREYPGYDLASPGQRLLELSQVIDGPEIEFAPEFVDGTTKQFVQWRMRIGNSRLGNLNFAYQWVMNKALCDIERGTDGSARTNRQFERGNGMNRDLIIGFYDVGVNPLDSADILLEEVGTSHTDASILSTLNGWAQSAVEANTQQVYTWNIRVRLAGDDGHGSRTNSPHMAEVLNGDNGHFILRNHVRVPDGTYANRIVGMRSAGSAQEVELRTQFLQRVA